MTCIMPKKVAQAEKALSKENLSLANFHMKYDTTEKRVEFLTQQFNSKPEAEFFNRKFERFLLSNQKDRLKEWATRSAEKGIDTDTTKTLLEKIEKLSKPLQGKNYNALDNQAKQLLSGLVEQKLGFALSKEDLKTIISKNNNIKATKNALLAKFPDYEDWGKTADGQKKFLAAWNAELSAWEKNKDNKGPILQYGLAVLEMKKVYDYAKIKADQKRRLKAESKAGRVAKGGLEVLSSLAGGLKSMKASFDASFGRQLSSALMGYFKSAGGGELTGLKTVFKYLTHGFKLTEQQLNTLELMVIVRPNSVNGNYRKLGIAVGIQEEAYPTAFERIESILKKDKGEKGEPKKKKDGTEKEKGGTRNPFLASEVAFTNAIQIARANIADEMIIANNGDIGTLKEQKAGDFINMITGRGKLPINNENASHYINTLMFSPRWFMSRLELLFDLRKVGYVLRADKTGQHQIDRARFWAAARQLAFTVLLTAAAKGALRAGRDDKEYGEENWEQFLSAFDARSTDFGKLIWGDTRFDTSFGYAAIIVAITRMLSGQKVTVSGTVRDVKWGEVLGTFFEGKASPMASVASDTWKYAIGKVQGREPRDFMYQPITSTSLLGKVAPIPITIANWWEAGTIQTEDRWAAVVGALLDMFGFGTNTYGISEKDVGKSDELKKAERILAYQENRTPTSLKPSKQSSIMKKLSGAKQERAVADYEKALGKKLDNLVKSSSFKRMSSSDQAEAMKKAREQVNKDIKKKYGLK